MLYFINFLRAIAVALIANSHFKGVYPSDVMSFGGGLGLALFYMISGYLMSNINKETIFGKWYLNKIIRLYVPLWILRIFQFIIGYKTITTVKGFIWELIFPTHWFITSMIITYIIYFIFVKYIVTRYESKSVYIFEGLLVIIFVVLYVSKSSLGTFSFQTLTTNAFSLETPYFIMQVVWLLCMLIGLSLRGIKNNKHGRGMKTRCLIGASCNIMLFMFVKLTIKHDIFIEGEFLLAVSYIGFAFALFKLFMYSEVECKKVSNQLLGKVIKIISVSSLEIYYIQFIWIDYLKKIIFPVNILLISVCIMLSGYLLHLLADYVITKMRSIAR